MKTQDKERTIMYAEYYVLKNATVRKVAKHFGASKTTVHNKLVRFIQQKHSTEKYKVLSQEALLLLEIKLCIFLCCVFVV